jgi:hypothetical protein
MRSRRRAAGCWLSALLLASLLLSAELADAKKKKAKKKKKPKTVQDQINKRLLKLAAGDESKLGALTEMTDAMMPAQGESWSLSEDGSNVLEPYAVGSTLMVEALDMREEEPQLWADLASWISDAAAGDAGAKSQLQELFASWGELPSKLEGSHKEAVAASSALAWLSVRATEALTCLPVGSCGEADAWLATRQLGEACRGHQGKYSKILEAHDIMIAVLQPLHKLAELMVAGYELDFTVRPDGVAERIKAKEAAMKERDAAKRDEEAVVEEVEAGALDKPWSKLTPEEQATATALGYTERSFMDTAPPLRDVWADLSDEQTQLATSLGWEQELWDNELEALFEEEAEARAQGEL